jgi:hypothetical protein
VTLASLLATGEPRLSRTNADRVREWVEARGVSHVRPQVPRSATRPTAPSPRPPHAEVLGLWARARVVTDDADVSAWLLSRGLEPSAVEEKDLIRALPGGTLPRWARSRSGSWAESGHRALFALVDAHGALVSLRARCVTADARPAKALSPAGFSVSGLVLADALAQLLLAGEPLGDGSPVDDLVVETGLVVVEGEPDWLTWAARPSDADERAPAVLGLVAGSWSPDLARRVPSGVRVALRTHRDSAGDAYAEKVAADLSERCHIFRLDAEGGSP